METVSSNLTRCTMNTDLMFSSKTDKWETPQNFFDNLNQKYNFTLDVCADETNHKCEKYFNINQDGLSQDWSSHVCWMNPPYGRTIGRWVKKAYEESFNGATVVCLLPARTDTKWFHDYCVHGEVTFIKGRLKFGGSKNAAPFPSMLVVFAPVPALSSKQDAVIGWKI